MSGSVDIRVTSTGRIVTCPVSRYQGHLNWEDCNMSGSVDIRVTSTGRIVTCLGQ